VLTASEILVPGLVIIWLGISAIVVGAIDYMVDISVAVQIYIWTALSVISLLAWFGYFKRTWRSPVGQSRGEYVHISGTITQKLGGLRYKAEFDLPILGDRKWIVETDENLEVGERVGVSKVYGQIIKVHRKKGD
jgi:membrane protein implicated in regulation of membrane protease activity